jgi:iron-sulfur cluster assembly protein
MMSIKISDEALGHIKGAMKPDQGLRVAVQGGGCSGYTIKMKFEAAPKPGDRIFVFDGLTVFIDAFSYLYLEGLEIGWESRLEWQGVTFHTPAAKRTCGCGNSFGI